MDKSVTDPANQIACWDRPDRRTFETEIMPSGRPALLRGIAAEWPAVQRAQAATAQLAQYLRSLDQGAPIGALKGRPGSGGRYFYDAAMTGFNFDRVSVRLSQVVEALLATANDPNPVSIYAGSILSGQATPRFAHDNPMPLLPAEIEPRLWLGNRSRVAAHYDNVRNFACCVSGRRRFTMFPPDQVANLYVGPFEFTIAGQPVSLVDFAAPDHARFPRFAAAQAAAIVADLEPGDAVYIPTLWFHHVEAEGAFNLLVNYWWSPPGVGPALEGLMTSMLGIRDQPAPERAAWRAFFDHYVFGDDASHAADHLPPRWRTVTGPPGPERDEMVRGFVLGRLSEGVRKRD